MKMWHRIRIPCCLVDGSLAQTILYEYAVSPTESWHACYIVYIAHWAAVRDQPSYYVHAKCLQNHVYVLLRRSRWALPLTMLRGPWICRRLRDRSFLSKHQTLQMIPSTSLSSQKGQVPTDVSWHLSTRHKSAVDISLVSCYLGDQRKRRCNTSPTHICLWFDIAQTTTVITVSSIIITLADSHCQIFLEFQLNKHLDYQDD